MRLKQIIVKAWSKMNIFIIKTILPYLLKYIKICFRLTSWLGSEALFWNPDSSMFIFIFTNIKYVKKQFRFTSWLGSKALFWNPDISMYIFIFTNIKYVQNLFRFTSGLGAGARRVRGHNAGGGGAEKHHHCGERSLQGQLWRVPGRLQ